MFKRIIIAFVLVLFANTAFAIDKNELNMEFFERFNDDYLAEYVNLAIDNNHNAKQASKRVEQYRQQVKYSFSKELPSLRVNADYLGVKVPKLDNFSLSKNAFVLPFLANYEADFLLKNRDKTKSSKKSYEISKSEEKAVYIALVTDVATVYANILSYDELIKLAEEQVEISTAVLKSDKQKYSRGVINSVQLNNSEKNLAASKNTLEKLQKEEDVLLMQLAVLTGKSSSEAKNLLRGDFADFEYKSAIPCEISSDVIFSRPDIMAAEKQLEKAKIDVRVARKEFFSTFNVTGIWAFNTIAPGTFFSWQSSLAAIIAGASQDIFTGGRKIVNLKIQKSKYEEIFEKYQQTDLDAVKEVNTALCFIKHDQEVDYNTLQKLNFETKNLDASKRKISQGTISNPEYLFELSNVVNLQQEAVKSKTQRLVNYFTLYKSVGGNL